jgi:hypothetical protein
MTKEALRFARNDGIYSDDVQTRLSTAEEEITAMERYDLNAETISKLTDNEKILVDNYMPQFRSLRQSLMMINSVDDLENVAALAGNLNSHFRVDVMQILQEKIDNENKKQ